MSKLTKLTGVVSPLPHEISIDEQGSIRAPPLVKVLRQWSLFGDFRSLGTVAELENRDGETNAESDIQFRIHTGVTGSFTDQLRGGIRLAAACTSESCSPESILDEATTGSTDH